MAVKWEEEDPDVKNSNQTMTNPDSSVSNSSSFSGNHTSLFMDTYYRHILCNTSSVLTIFFAAEVIMKMIAFTPYGYWQSRRNRADMIVTILGVVWIIVDNIFKNTLTLTFGKYEKSLFVKHDPAS